MFLTEEQLEEKNFNSIGRNVKISEFCTIYNSERISIDSNVRIDDFCILSGGSGLKIGSYCHIACYVSLFGGAGIIIGNFVGISSRSCLYSQSDDYSGQFLYGPMVPDKYKKIDSGEIIIKDYSIIGTCSTIMPGVLIWEGTAIGAYSLVKEDCLPWSIYAGVPAKKIKDRKQDLLLLEKKLLEESRKL